MATKKEFGMTYNPDPPSKLSFLERFAYGTGDFAGNIVYSAISIFLVFYYTDVVHADAAAVGTIMLVSRIFDGISDIIMGIIVDRTKSKFGKARVWLARLAIPYALSAVILFSVPTNASNTFKLIYIFLSYNLVSTVIFTAINVPYATMNAMMTQNQYERTLLGTFRMLLATAGTLFINTFTLKVVNAFGGDAKAWTLTFVVFGVLSIVIFLFSFFFTHERVIEEQNSDTPKANIAQEFGALLKNKYWLIVALVVFIMYFSLTVGGGTAIYYAKAVLNDQNLVGPLGNATTIAQIATMFVAAPLFVKRMGKGKAMGLGMSISAIGYLMTALVGANYTLIMVSNVIKGIGNGFAASCMWGMLSDTIEYGEWKTGIRSAGLANAASSFGSKVGSGVAGAVLGWVMAAGGYDATAATQSASAVAAVSTLYIYLPLAISVISAVVLLVFYKLDKEYDGIIADLEVRKGIK
ncbi:MFS transporter [Streptococcus sp. S784/96/1]|uniref:MFS transporter n=1 Tax=Streptococcus sp. S784/96/1 TaxID=2653499 RepID=UPI00192E3584|nr:glycoside-pentoside-hexuronide (GPH):cation symporter [Streptococcus sp. S784/96/1]